MLNYGNRFEELAKVDREFLESLMIEAKEEAREVQLVQEDEQVLNTDTLGALPAPIPKPEDVPDVTLSADLEMPPILVSSRGRAIIRRTFGDEWVT